MARRRRPSNRPPESLGNGSAAPPPAPVAHPGRPAPLWIVAVAAIAALGALLLLQPRETPAAAGFDAAAAWKHLAAQVEFGPRVPGTPAHVKCRDYLVDALRPLADGLQRQEFSMRLDGRSRQMSNLIARWKGTGGSRAVLLCAHWDTRPTADEEFDPARRAMPIPGANDGASGVAVLLEAARLFHRRPPPVPVMIVLFDGEDYGPDTDRMFLGSRHFADRLPADVPRRGILLDMVGDADLAIPREGNSVQHAPALVEEVYALARRLGYEKQFPNRPGPFITDDHLQLLARGLQVIDLIDFDYPFWHTLEDTPERCSPASLKAVGDVVATWVYEQK